MKILVLSRYSSLGASSRIRFIQYVPLLISEGFQVTVAPLFNDKYVMSLQEGKRNKSQIIFSYLTRIALLLKRKTYDLIWMEKEALPWIPYFFESALISSGTPLVLDFDDAVFVHYDEHTKRAVRTFLGGKYGELMRRATLVTAGNEYLAQYARNAGAKNVEVFPTVVDLNRYPARDSEKKSQNDSIPNIIWIGQSSTGHFLKPMIPLIKRFSDESLARFKAIGIDSDEVYSPIESLPWSEESEFEQLMLGDIGIMPLSDGPFERGKCGYKLIQYMACGLPVVASPVGVNEQIVDHGVNGLLAGSLDEWAAALRKLISDPALREQMGKAGREKVEKHFSLQVLAPRLLQSIKNAISESKN